MILVALSSPWTGRKDPAGMLDAPDRDGEKGSGLQGGVAAFHRILNASS